MAQFCVKKEHPFPAASHYHEQRAPRPSAGATGVSSYFNLALAAGLLPASNMAPPTPPALNMCVCPSNPGYMASFKRLDALKPFILHLRTQNLSAHTSITVTYTGAVL